MSFTCSVVKEDNHDKHPQYRYYFASQLFRYSDTDRCRCSGACCLHAPQKVHYEEINKIFKFYTKCNIKKNMQEF